MTITNKQLADQLSSKTGLDSRLLEKFISATAHEIVAKCSELNTVAIPGFGNFSAEKINESIVADSEGKRTLFPPRIQMTFRQSVVLRKRLADER